jgi:hypothetical protein
MSRMKKSKSTRFSTDIDSLKPSDAAIFLFPSLTSVDRLGAKIVRLTADLRRARGGGEAPPKYDEDTENIVADLNRRLHDVKKENDELKLKLLNKKKAPPGSAMKGTKTPRSVETDSGSEKPDGNVEKLQQVVTLLRGKLLEAEKEIFKQRHELAVANSNAQANANAAEDGGWQTGSDVVELERSLREKGARLTQLTHKFEAQEAQVRHAREQNEILLSQMEDLNNSLREERKRVLQLQSDARHNSHLESMHAELTAVNDDLRAELKLLQDEHHRLLTTAFQQDRPMQEIESQHARERTEMATKIRLLETQVERLQAELTEVKAKNQQAVEEVQRGEQDSASLQERLQKLQRENDVLKEHLAVLSGEGGIALEELHAALAIIRQQNECLQRGELLSELEDKTLLNANRELSELRAWNAELCQELEKTQRLLRLQERINKDKVNLAGTEEAHLAQLKEKYEKQLETDARIMDARAHRIARLEEQLRQAMQADGKSVLIRAGTEESQDTSKAESDDLTADLAENENILEFTVESFHLNKHEFPGLSAPPEVFFTFDFFEHPTQTTSVRSAYFAGVSFTAQYVVTVDDFLLHYMQRRTMSLELMQARGVDFECVGRAHVSFRSMLERNGTVHLSAEILSTSRKNTVLGTVRYSMKFLVHNRELLSRFRQREWTQEEIKDVQGVGGETAQRSIVVVNIKQCADLTPRLPDSKPAPYVYFQWAAEPETETKVIRNSHNPVFNEQFVFPIRDLLEFETFVSSERLQVCVFDDADENEDFYFGTAELVLAPLVMGEDIEGEFLLKRNDGSAGGAISLAISLVRRDAQTGNAPVSETSLPPPQPTPQRRSQQDLSLSEQVQIRQSQQSQLARTSTSSVGDPSGEGLQESAGVISETETSTLVEGESSSLAMGVEETEAETEAETTVTHSEVNGSSSVATLPVVPAVPPRGGGASPTKVHPPTGASTTASAAIEVVVERVQLSETTLDRCRKDDMLFVALYKFLDKAEEDLQSEVMAPSPSCTFNYRQTFELNTSQQREGLLQMLADKDEAAADIVIAVVKENKEGQCLELGTGYVSLKDILHDKSDVKSASLQLLNARDQVIGEVTVTCDALAAMELVQGEETKEKAKKAA